MFPSSLSPLLNHLWQSTLFAGAVGLLTLALRRNSARVRYGLWMAASIKFLVPFALFVTIGGLIGQRSGPAAIQPSMNIVVEEIAQTLTPVATAAPLPSSGTPSSSPVPALLFGIWALGSVCVGASWWLRWRRVRAAVRAGSTMQFDIPVPVISSPALLEPGVFGIAQPVLLLPQGITEHLTPEQLEAIVAHELCHVRRRDNLTATVHMLVEAIFWFHPLVWWIRTRLAEERERACDEEVVRIGNEPRAYAQGILKVCELYLESPVACVAGVSGSNLRRRIEAILTDRAVKAMGIVTKVSLCAIGAITLALPILLGHLKAQPLAFEVASVKPSPPGLVRDTGGVQIRFAPSGGFVASNAGLIDLVMRAYNLEAWQVSGGPEWGRPKGMSNDDRFVVEAKPASAVSIAESRRMLQTLLADRFQLRVHRETKTQTVYDLVVAKNGPKMQEIKIDNYSGNLVSRCCRGGMYMDRTTMADFAETFTMLGVHTTVRDRTRLKGVYKFELHWSPEEYRSGDKQDVAGDGETGFERDAPSLASALREQLGLTLESAKGPVEFLVIDHAEKPSKN